MNAVRQLRTTVKNAEIITTVAYVNCFWRTHQRRARPHGIPGTLAVTLTSYPPRYPTLALTLKSIMAQSVRPDRIYLWIAKDDLHLLPANVLELQHNGLLIRSCEDIRSYKKIIPALTLRGEDFLVTADDDVYYPRHWLRAFAQAYRPGCAEVLCGRARRISVDERGRPVPYANWPIEDAPGGASRYLFPTGVGGVMYARDIFHVDVLRSDLFSSLCPTADDVWLYWMAALKGATFRKVGRLSRMVSWLDSQRVALYAVNYESNDHQIEKMICRYGFPSDVASSPERVC